MGAERPQASGSQAHGPADESNHPFPGDMGEGHWRVSVEKRNESSFKGEWLFQDEEM